MKKFLSIIFLMLFAAMSVTQSEAQNKSYLVTRTAYNSVWNFRMDSVIGKGLLCVQLYDSVAGAWLSPSSAVVTDSLVADTISNAKDAAFLVSLRAHQKISGNTYGNIPFAWSYTWIATGRVYYKARYTKMLLFYKL